MKFLSFSVKKIYQTKALRAIVTKNLKIFELRFLFVSEYSQVLKAETTLKPVRIFRVVLLFSYQRTLSLSVSSCRSQQRQLIHISIISFVCQELF